MDQEKFLNFWNNVWENASNIPNVFEIKTGLPWDFFVNEYPKLLDSLEEMAKKKDSIDLIRFAHKGHQNNLKFLNGLEFFLKLKGEAIDRKWVDQLAINNPDWQQRFYFSIFISYLMKISEEFKVPLREEIKDFIYPMLCEEELERRMRENKIGSGLFLLKIAKDFKAFNFLKKNLHSEVRDIKILKDDYQEDRIIKENILLDKVDEIKVENPIEFSGRILDGKFKDFIDQVKKDLAKHRRIERKMTYLKRTDNFDSKNQDEDEKPVKRKIVEKFSTTPRIEEYLDNPQLPDESDPDSSFFENLERNRAQINKEFGIHAYDIISLYLTEGNLTDTDIAQKLGISVRSVERYRKRFEAKRKLLFSLLKPAS